MEYFGTNLLECGHYRFELDGDYMRKTYNNYPYFNDLPFHPEKITNNLQNGEVVYFQGGGITAIGIAGSCTDKRPGGKSIFWVKELINRDAMIQRIMQNHAAMHVIRALPFEIKWNL